jgi:ABC transporter substrate binding protein
MKRREFITMLAGGAAASWSPEADAQQPEPMRRIGVLMGIAESDPAQQAFVSAFTEALRGLGWQADRNIRIDYRWGGGDADKIQSFAREFVEQKPDLIVGHTTPVVAALKQQTSTIPIVFTQVSDPVGSHFVDGLARPRRKHHRLHQPRGFDGGEVDGAVKGSRPQYQPCRADVQSGDVSRWRIVFPGAGRGGRTIAQDGVGCSTGSQPRRHRFHHGVACA